MDFANPKFVQRQLSCGIHSSALPLLPFLLMSSCFSLITLIYFHEVVLCSSPSSKACKIQKSQRLGFFFCLFLLVILPFSKKSFFSQQWQSFYLFVSGLIFFVCVERMETIRGKVQCLAPYFAIIIVFRVVNNNTLLDNLALCIAYSFDVSALHNNATQSFFASKFLIWGSFLFVLLVAHIMQRIRHKTWEYIRIILIFKEKRNHEHMVAQKLLSSHYPRDLMDESILVAQSTTSATSNSNTRDDGMTELERAIKSNILTTKKKKGHTLPGLSTIEGWKGTHRKTCAIIAVKHEANEDRDYVLNGLRGYAVHDFLDALAQRHKISCVRKVGDTWIGCVGYFKSWDSGLTNCFQAVQFGCEVAAISEHFKWKFSCTIDYGSVVGTYSKSGFDLFGAEIRWVLSHAELQGLGEVMVSGNVRHLFLRHQQLSTATEKSISFNRTLSQPLFSAAPEEKMFSVEDCSSLLGDTVENLIAQTEPVAIRSSQDSLASNDLQDILDEHERLRGLGLELNGSNTNSPIMSEYGLLSHGRAYGHMANHDAKANVKAQAQAQDYDANNITLKVIIEKWMKELHYYFEAVTFDPLTEHRKSNLQDKILERYSLQDLETLHQEIEAEIADTIFRCHFKGNFLNLIFFLNPRWQNGPPKPPQHVDGGGIDLDDAIASNGISRKPVQQQEIQEVRNSRGWHSMSWLIWLRSFRFWRSVGFSYGPSLGTVAPQCNNIAELSSAPDAKAHQANEGDHNISIWSSIKTAWDAMSVVGVDINGRGGGSPHDDKRKRSTSSRQWDKVGERERKNGSRAQHFTSPVIVTWPQYASEAKHPFPPDSIVTAITGMFFVACSLYVMVCVLVNLLTSSSECGPRGIEIIGFLAFLHILVTTLPEREYEKAAYSLIVIIRMLMVVTVPMDFIEDSATSAYMVKGDRIGFGNGGETDFLLCFMLSVPISLRQPFTWAFVDYLLICALGYLWRHLKRAPMRCNGTYSMPVESMAAILAFIVCRLVVAWVVEYTIYVSYVAKHEIIPAARQAYLDEVEETKKMIKECSPVLAQLSASAHLIYNPHRYRSCTVAVIHVKAADLLPGMLDDVEISNFLAQIIAVITSCITECGMMSVSSFSGVITAVSCQDVAWQSIKGLDVPVDHKSRGVVLFKTLQEKMNKFNREQNINVTLGGGLHHGSALVGLLGDSRRCFDVSGAARDAAFIVATSQDGLYASTSLESELKRSTLNLTVKWSNKIRQTARGNIEESTWVKLGDKFSGMQLDDFEYICMLGRGGYGSVHLLKEKDTGTEYAIKAIPKKHGSAISTMIQREFIILQKMQHKTVINFQYCMLTKTRIYLVMAYVRGGNLKQIVDSEKPEIHVLIVWFAELVLALEYVHSLGIIHRDVKPANCMIEDNGHLKLVDFGLSKIVTANESLSADSKSEVPEIVSSGTIDMLRKIIPLKPDIATENKETISYEPVQILLIDKQSEADSANNVSLHQMQFEVTITTSIDQAESILASETNVVELILFDLDMGGRDQLKNNFNLLKRLCDEYDKPVIVLYHDDDSEVNQHCLDVCGAKHMIVGRLCVSDRAYLLRYGLMYRRSRAEGDSESGSRSRSSSFSSILGAYVSSNAPSLPVLDERVGDVDLAAHLETMPDKRTTKNLINNTDDLARNNCNDLALVDASSSFKSGNDGDDGGGDGLLDEGDAGIDELRPKNGTPGAPQNPLGMTSAPDMSQSPSATPLPSTLGTHNPQETDSEYAKIATSSLLGGGNNPQKDFKKVEEEHSAVGTIHYMAPEVITSRIYHKAVDWWACGVTFCECVTREHLFTGSDRSAIASKIKSGDIDLSAVMDRDLEHLIRGLVERDHGQRLGSRGAGEIKQHPFFRGIDWDRIVDSDSILKPGPRSKPQPSDDHKAHFYDYSDPSCPDRSQRRRMFNARNGRKKLKKANPDFMKVRKEKNTTFYLLAEKRRSWVSGTYKDKEVDVDADSSYRSQSMSMSRSVSMSMGGRSIGSSIEALREESGSSDHSGSNSSSKSPRASSPRTQAQLQPHVQKLVQAQSFQTRTPSPPPRATERAMPQLERTEMRDPPSTRISDTVSAEPKQLQDLELVEL